MEGGYTIEVPQLTLIASDLTHTRRSGPPVQHLPQPVHLKLRPGSIHAELDADDQLRRVIANNCAAVWCSILGARLEHKCTLNKKIIQELG